MKRLFDPAQPEMMDRPQPVSDELREDLENLRKLNRYFGSYRLIRRFLSGWLPRGRTCRMLDLATGYGDIPRMIVDWARAHDVSVRIDAVDFRESTIELARGASSGYPEIEYIHDDVRTFQSPLTYDVVLCTLALHHFSEEEAAHILGRTLFLSHDRVLVSDLERTWFSWLGVRLLTALVFRESMTRFDARLSVRRAFSFAELRALAEAAGWERFRHRRFIPARQAIWVCVQREAPQLDVRSAPDFACP